MDKLPVGQLPDLQQSNNDDEIMVITNSEYNQLKKEKISDLITDFTSTNENNALTKGTDGKMFVTDFGNASNITEGTLPTSVLPEIPLEKLPVSGVSADTYTYPSSVTVNAQGQVTGIVEGAPGANNANQDLSNLSPEGEKHFLNKTQITNCILEAPNGDMTYNDTTITLKAGLKFLIPNSRNEDKTLKNIEYTVPEDKTINYTGVGDETFDFTLLYGNTGRWELSQNYQEADTPPTFYGNAQCYLNTKENIMYFNNNNTKWEPVTVAVLGKGRLENGVIVSFTPYQPVELLKRSDLQNELNSKLNADHSNDTKPYILEMYNNGTSGYMIYSNGFCEQWGTTAPITGNTNVITLLKEYANTNYNVYLTSKGMVATQYSLAGMPITADTFNIGIFTDRTAVCWRTIGYIS